MLDYNDLNDDEKRTLRNTLRVDRIHQFYLEDNNILLMEDRELFEYIYIFELKKVKDAINLIDRIVKLEITAEDVNKSIIQKLLESKDEVIRLSDKHYAYKEN